ncbi:MAG: PGF-pre-PGF domain-containing protein [archaeon]
MSKITKKLLISVFAALMCVLFAFYATAAGPGSPTNYNGYATCNGYEIPAGAIIWMESEGRNVSTDGWTDTTNFTYYDPTQGTPTDRYFLHLQWRDIGDPLLYYGADDGDPVTIYVNGINASLFTADDSQSSVLYNLSFSDSVSPSNVSTLSAQELAVQNQSVINISFWGTRDNLWTNLYYLVYRGTSSSVTFADGTRINATLFNGTGRITINDTLPARGQTYYYAVYANDTSGNLGARAISNAVSTTNLVPAQVTGGAASSNNNSLNITWTAVTTHNNGTGIGGDLVGYHVYKNVSDVWVLTTTTTNTFYYNNSLTNNQPYQFKVAAYDLDSNEGQNSSVISGTPSERPTITMTSPANYLFIRSGVSLNFSVTSGALQNVWYSPNGGATNSTFVSPYGIDTTAWTNTQSYIVVVGANNTNGQSTVETYNVTIDNNKPTVTNLAVNDSDSIVSSGVSIRINVTSIDLSPFTSILVGNSTMVTMAQLSGNHYTAITTASTLGCPGTNQGCRVIVNATDYAGNSNDTIALFFTVDNIAPTVSNPYVVGGLINTTDDLVRENDTISVNVTVTDSNAISSVSVNSQPMNSVGNNKYNYTGSALALCGASDGTCTLTFVATDVVGNINSTTTKAITVDDSAPTISSVTISDNYISNNTNVTVTVAVTDSLTAVHNVSVEGVLLTSQGGGVWNGTLNLTDETVDAVDVAAFDIVGNSDTDSATTYTMDNTAPYINSIILSDYYVRSGTPVTVTINVTDNAINTVTAEGVTLNNSGDIWSGIITLALGGSPINVVAIDNASNQRTNNSIGFSTDDISPYYNSIALSDSYVRPGATVTITANITENHMTSVTADGTSLSNSTADIWTGSITLGDASGYVTLVATDDAGNTNTSVFTTYTIDSTAPTFSITTPEADGIYTNADGNITFSFIVYDANISKVNVSIDNGLYMYGNTTNGTHIVQFTGLLAGEHSAVFSASDEAGNNATEVTRAFTIVAPLNLTEYTLDLDTSLGSPVRSINFSLGGVQVTNNESISANNTFALAIELNASNIIVNVEIPQFSGLDAVWERTFLLNVNATSASGLEVAENSGLTLSAMVLFVNTTDFLDDEDYLTGARITFNRSLNDLDVLYIADDSGETIYVLSACDSVPNSTITLANMCYANTSSNITLYVPHFSGGALGNDTVSPQITMNEPVAGAIANSYFLYNITVNEANPTDTGVFCWYIFNGTDTQYNLTLADFTETGTEYKYAMDSRFYNITNGSYKVTTNCTDLKNQTEQNVTIITIADSTAARMSYGNPSVSTTTASIIVGSNYTYDLVNYTMTYGTNASSLTVNKNSTSYDDSFILSLTGLSASTKYYYNFTACDINGNCVQTVVWNFTTSVVVAEEDDSPTGGSSSRPPGDSSSLANLKAVASWSNVVPNTPYKMNVTNVNIPLRLVTFEVEEGYPLLTLKLTGHDSNPSVETGLLVYKYFEAAKTPVGANLRMVLFRFSVEKTWIAEKQVAKERIVLLHYNNVWEELTTKQTGEDSGNVYYEAYVSEFSYFAIAVKAAEAPLIVAPVEQQPPVATPPAATQPPATQPPVQREPPATEKKQSDVSFNTIIVIIVLACFAGAGAIFIIANKLKNLKQIMKEHGVHEPHGDTEKLENYVSKALDSGHHHETVSKHLVKHGWDKEVVEKTVHKVKQEKESQKQTLKK